jgi:hypothetical protein
MSQPTEYRIEHVRDLLALPADKMDACLSQLRLWTKHMAYLQAIKHAHGPSFAATVDNMADRGFVWIDDGRDGCSGVRLEVERAETKEGA